jgi:hypothetical protein
MARTRADILTLARPLVIALAFLAQLAVAQQPVAPVTAYPDAILDDTAAYQGYQTRFYRDAARNTLQVYIDERSNRVVHVFADADNASIAFSTRTAAGAPAPLRWTSAPAQIRGTGRTRAFLHQLTADVPHLNIGWFQLGSMRVERDLQYFEKVKGSFAGAPYRVDDVDHMVNAVAALPPAVRTRHLRLLNARSVAALRARVYPRATITNRDGMWVARLVHAGVDGRDTLTLELRAKTADVAAALAGDSLSLTARSGGRVTFDVEVTTTARTLTPLTRAEIFTPDFLAFLADTKTRAERVPPTDTAAIRARRMERQVTGVELLVSREKLMAGLPTYATYFGRDMLMSALMMQPIWQHAAVEASIAAALGKLGPSGEVSHEEALGGQAERESGAEYAALIDSTRARRERGDRAGADAALARAERVLRTVRATRENYHMVDDEYQLVILAARWITDPSVSVSDKKQFLAATAAGTNATNATQLLRELALVAKLTAPYAANPVVSNLIAFSRRAPGVWATESWRDSGAGYGNGRYAMDINAIWVPHALESLGQILDAFRELGLLTDSAVPASSELAAYLRDRSALTRAISVWRTASRHFVVALSGAQVQAAVSKRLAAMPADERGWWMSRPMFDAALRDSLTFLDVALDSMGVPVGIVNSDPATQLFLGNSEDPSYRATSADFARIMRDVRAIARPYPAGLLIDRIGIAVSNDAYSTPDVWNAFVKDPYHGPKVVWGREVNLFLLGVARQLALAQRENPGAAAQMREALENVRTAVEQSGFHTELWSYAFSNGKLGALRYGSGNDIQLWSTTDLAVQYTLSKLQR